MATDLRIPSAVERWIDDGRADVARFAYNGLGIELHGPQIEVAQAILSRCAAYYDLDWANRAGKTTLLCVVHMHQCFYKPWLHAANYGEWRKSDYVTLHCAPLNELAGRAHTALQEIIRDTHPAQRDLDTGARRLAPLGAFFAAIKERDNAGADRMVLRCQTGAKTDFRSTEGKAARLESGAWRLITWDEWPANEGEPDDIRYIVDVRLTNRAADFDAPIVLTGTRTPDTEHIAREFAEKVDDPENTDWWGNHATRMDNPSHSPIALARAKRNMAEDDYNRTILGVEGGVKGRIFPRFLVDRMFDNALPSFTPPGPLDGATFDTPLKVADADGPRRFRPNANGSEWTYLHLWDIAIAAAENVGIVLRIPADWKFSHERPVVGVKLTVIPGSRTLTSAEIVHTIEETFLPYGGEIAIDTTDAHGKSIHRDLRAAGYPAHAFDFHARVAPRNQLRKDRGIGRLRALMADGLAFAVGKDGEPLIDEDDVVKIDLSKPFGAISLPKAWTKVRDQVSLLRPDNERQRKDAAMSLMMGGDMAIGRRRSLAGPAVQQNFVVFAGGHV